MLTFLASSSSSYSNSNTTFQAFVSRTTLFLPATLAPVSMAKAAAKNLHDNRLGEEKPFGGFMFKNFKLTRERGSQIRQISASWWP